MGFRSAVRTRHVNFLLQFWETDFYTPPVLGGAALFPGRALHGPMPVKTETLEEL